MSTKMVRAKTAPLDRKLVSVGKYELTGKLLGKGNFARVEEAVHTVLKTKVAIKIMDTSQIKEEYVVRNLEREARIMSYLSHPCIAALFETLQCGNVYYLVTELATGGDMCTFVKTQKLGRLDEPTTRIYARQVIAAIGHMHSRGIVHRDLKMENIMVLSNKHQIKIVDFGLSNIWTPDCPLRTHCGSPEYAAPELFIIGRHYGPEVDLWSLGVILYGMVTGRLPFMNARNEAMTSQEKRQKLLAQINRGLTNVHKKELQSLSSDFKHLVANLLIPRASDRINTDSLLCHHWVTNRQRKAIKINTLMQRNPSWQNIIIDDIANTLETDPQSVSQEIKTNRYGEIGGMYNIKKYMQIIRNTRNEKEYLSKQLQVLTPRNISVTTSSKNTIKNTINSNGTTSRHVPIETMNSARETKEEQDVLTHRIQNDNRKRQINRNILNTNTINNVSNQISKIIENNGAPRRILSPPIKLLKNTSAKTSHNQLNQSQISSQQLCLHKKSQSDEYQKYRQTQLSSIPRPVNPCPLHPRLNTNVPYSQNKSQWNTSINCTPRDTQKYSKLSGTYGIKRPFNQRPATVHPKLKNNKEEKTKLTVSKSSTSPTSAKINLRNLPVVEISGCGDQNTIYRENENHFVNKTNPIAKSIADYIKNISQEEKYPKLLRVKKFVNSIQK